MFWGFIQHLSLVRPPFRQWMQRQPVGSMQSTPANMERVTPPSSKKGRRSYVLQRDFRVLEREQRVTRILNSGAFRSELEGIMKSQIDGSRRPPKLSKAIQRLQENVVEATASRHGQGTGSLQVTVPAQPVLPIDDLRGVNASKYTLAERHLRCKLAAVYRLVDMFGWSQLIHNHITVRATGEKDQFLVNPFGLLYGEITASSLVRVDLQGQIVSPGGTQLGVNQAGFALHAAIHAARRDVNCVIHVHTTAGTAVSSMNCGLLPISQEATSLGGISYHENRGVCEDDRKMLVKDLGPQNKVLILRNHGVVAMGSSVEEAFHYTFHLVRACEIQVAAMSAGLANLSQSPGGVWGCTRGVAERGGAGMGAVRTWRVGELEFEALMRMLDNKGYNTGYRYKGLRLLEPPLGSPKYKREKDDSHLADRRPSSTETTSVEIHSQLTEQFSQNLQRLPDKEKSIWNFLEEGEDEKDFPIFKQRQKNAQAKLQATASDQKCLWGFLDSPKGEEVPQPHLRHHIEYHGGCSPAEEVAITAVPLNGTVTQAPEDDREDSSLKVEMDQLPSYIGSKQQQEHPKTVHYHVHKDREAYPPSPHNLTPLELAQYTAEQVAHYTGQAVKTLLSHKLQHTNPSEMSPSTQAMDSSEGMLSSSEQQPAVTTRSHPTAAHYDSSRSSADDEATYSSPISNHLSAFAPAQTPKGSDQKHSTAKSMAVFKKSSPLHGQFHKPAVIEYNEGCSPAEKAAITAQVVASSTSVAVQKLSDSFTDRTNCSSDTLPANPDSP